MACLTVTPSKITWRALFHFSVSLNIEDCMFIGVADMSKNNRGLPVVKGCEESFVYVSQAALPEKNRHTIDQVKCKKGFIRFAYSDKLCQALIAVLPKEKAKFLMSFYNYMQFLEKRNKRKKKRKTKNK